MLDSSFSSALSRAYFFLKFRPRTVWEMQTYLKKKGFTQKIVEQAIQELKDEKYLDDQEFIDLFVQNKIATNPKGKIVLTSQLLKLGIPKNLIDEYFEKTEIDEEKLAYDLLQKKLYRFKKYTGPIRTQKIISYLMQRGFSYSISLTIARKI